MKTYRARFRRGASVLTTALLVGLISTVAIVALTRLGGGVRGLFIRTDTTLSGVSNSLGGSGSSGSGGPTGGPFASCQAMKAGNAGMAGVSQQTITIAGTPRQVVCDMSTYGGGWTLVAAQFDSDPLGWNTGLANHGYAPALTDKISFVFSSGELPSHTQMAFGRIEGGGGGYTASMIDAVTGTYTTGNVTPPVSLTSINSATQYWMHRNSGGFYNCHEIDGTCSNGSQQGAGAGSWGSTLTFDIRSGHAAADWNWSFSPEHLQQSSRGFANAGDRQHTIESYAWAVWVR